MGKYKQLLEQFKAKRAEADALLAKGADITAEDVTKAKELNGECVALKGQMDELQALATSQQEHKDFLEKPVLHTMVPPGGTPQDPGAEVLGVTDAGRSIYERTKKGLEVFEEGEGLISEKQFKGICEPQYKPSLLKYIRAKGDMDMLDKIERKALQEGIDDQGGFLVPPDYLARLIEKKAAPTRVNELVTTLPTSRDQLQIPKVVYATDDIYSTGIRATLSGEIPASSTAHRVTEPVFGQEQIHIGTWMLSMPLTNDFIEDSAFPVLSWSMGKFEETIRLLFDDQILNGTGVGVRPHGIMKNPGGTNEVATTLSATANSIDADQIKSIPFDVPEQYLDDNARWIMNRGNCGKAIAILKDSQNRYLFDEGKVFPGLVGRTPDTLGGWPIAWSAFMPNIGNEAFPILFGNLKGYVKAQRVGFSIRVLSEIMAQDNQVVLLGRLRWGGKVAEPWTMRIGKSDNA